MYLVTKTGDALVAGTIGKFINKNVVRYNGTENQVCNFTIATGKDEQDNMINHKVEIWGALAGDKNIKPYNSIFVAGKEIEKSFKTRNGEEKTEKVIRVEWLDIKKTRKDYTENQSSNQSSVTSNVEPIDADDDDMPF